MQVKIVQTYNKYGEKITSDYRPHIPALEELLDRTYARIAQKSDEIVGGSAQKELVRHTLDEI